MLAYVFWHRPAPGTDTAAYEAGMRAFHAALGRLGSVTFAIDGTPWDGGPPAYEDWYPVTDWADLGRLNEEAISGARRAPHDAVAFRAAWGAGGVWKEVRPGFALAGATHATWFAKPPRVPDAEFVAGLPASGAVWQRQMVLGPAPEFVLLTAAPPAAREVPHGAVTTRVRDIARGDR